MQIAKVLDDPDEIKKYAIELSEHLTQVGDIKGAQDLLVRAELYREAVDLLNKNGKYEEAHEVADKYLHANEVRDMFVTMAIKLEENGN